MALADNARGWGLDDVTMTAERAEDGWVLDGTKVGVVADAETSEVAVIARAGDGVGAFVVPAADAGLGRRSFARCAPLATATLDRVLVTADRALGEPGSVPFHARDLACAAGGDGRACPRDRRRLRRPLPDCLGLREGP